MDKNPLVGLKTELPRPLQVRRKNWPLLQTGSKLYFHQLQKGKLNYTVPTLEGLGSIYQVGPVQWPISTSVRQRHEDRVLQLLLQLLWIFP